MAIFTMKMKMYNVTDLKQFMNLINNCVGDVYIVSDEGDKLNLKSKLTQYIALSNLLTSSYIKTLSLEIANEEDAAKFLSFMVSGEHQH